VPSVVRLATSAITARVSQTAVAITLPSTKAAPNGCLKKRCSKFIEAREIVSAESESRPAQGG